MLKITKLKPKTPTEVSAPYFQNPAQRLPLQSPHLRVSLHHCHSSALRPPKIPLHFSFLLTKFQLYPPSSPFLRSLCLFAAKTPRSRKPRNTRKPTKAKTPAKVSAPSLPISPKLRPPASETLLSVFLRSLSASAFRFTIPTETPASETPSSKFQLSAFQISALPMPPPPPAAKSTPSQKMAIASRLYATARKVKQAGLRRRHPDWSEERLKQELNLRFFLLHD